VRKVRAQIPNLFDQYSQPENRLTNALLQTLASSRRLSVAFLKDFLWIRCSPYEAIEISSQKRPGGIEDRGEAAQPHGESATIPDGWIVSKDGGWGLVIESKIQKRAVRLEQLRGHWRKASAYPQRHLLVLTPDRVEPPDVRRFGRGRPEVRWAPWTEIHGWVVRQAQREGRGSLGGHLVRSLKEYLEMDERLSEFQGFDFSEGFALPRAKAILKVLMETLRPEVRRSYPALTGGRGNLSPSQGSMWDCFGVEPKFTADLHLTLSVRPEDFRIGLIVPDAAQARWIRLKRVMADPALGEEFEAIVRRLRQGVPELWVRLDQRHFRNQREQISDATFEFKVDTAAFVRPKGGVKPFPVWFEMARQAVVRKRGINLQIGFWARFPFAALPETRTSGFKTTTLETLKRFKPLYKLLRAVDTSVQTRARG